jgi:RES domain-containing protein
MHLPPTHPVRCFDTHRLLPAKYSPDFASVLTRIADDQEHLDVLFELDAATNDRLLAEERGLPGIDVRELVYGVPFDHVINAAFSHANPLGARFSTPHRGAWYASLELATSKAEVLFHKSVEFAEIDWREREEVEYDDYLADFSAAFHDLRDRSEGSPEEAAAFADCLSPSSYVASQHLAEELLAAGSQGVIYPSVRRPGGTCIACFRPSVVSHVRKWYRYRLVWRPDRGGTIVRMSGVLLAEPASEEIGDEGAGPKPSQHQKPERVSREREEKTG